GLVARLVGVAARGEARARGHLHVAVLDQDGARPDREVELPVGRDVADRAAIDVSRAVLELADDLRRPGLGCAYDPVCRKRGADRLAWGGARAAGAHQGLG